MGYILNMETRKHPMQNTLIFDLDHTASGFCLAVGLTSTIGLRTAQIATLCLPIKFFRLLIIGARRTSHTILSFARRGLCRVTIGNFCVIMACSLMMPCIGQKVTRGQTLRIR